MFLAQHPHHCGLTTPRCMREHTIMGATMMHLLGTPEPSASTLIAAQQQTFALARIGQAARCKEASLLRAGRLMSLLLIIFSSLMASSEICSRGRMLATLCSAILRCWSG